MTSKEALKTMLTNFGLGEETTAEFVKCYDIVEKDLEVLEILKRKSVNVEALEEIIKIDSLRQKGSPMWKGEVYNIYEGEDDKFFYSPLELYNSLSMYGLDRLTEDEYNKVKEWLENGKTD